MDIISAIVVKVPSYVTTTSGLLVLGQFSQNIAHPGASYLASYQYFVSEDTLGWISFVCMGSTTGLETLVPIIQGLMSNPSAADLPVYVMLLLKLVIPLLATAVVAALIARSKRGAMTNALGGILIVAIAGIILTMIHIDMNWVSITWKFTDLASLNPIYAAWLSGFIFNPAGTMISFIGGIAAFAAIYAIFNSATVSLVSLGIAKRK